MNKKKISNISIMTEDYLMGLDIGTSSVGWATSDMNYRVIQRRRKSLWGVRLFEEGQKAEQRRIFRTQRRRYDRRCERLKLLQSLFAAPMAELDQGFFQRLKDSFFVREDKVIEQPNSLFDDESYQDKHFHQQYKTIYHLRHALMTSDEPHDLRLVYLAIHHIIKKRGHFLMKGESLSDVKDFSLCWQSFVKTLDHTEIREDISFEYAKAQDIAEALLAEESLNDKGKIILKKVGEKSWCKDENNCAKELIKLLIGGTCKLSTVFDLDPDDEEAQKQSICFKKDDYDAKAPAWATLLGDQFPLIEQAKAVYDWSILSRILKDSSSLSEAKIKSYEQHRADLAILKRVMKQLGKKELMFDSPDALNKKGVNYSNYVGYYKKGGNKITCDSCSYDDFCKTIKSQLPDLKKQADDLPAEILADTTYILERIEQGDFLPLQVQKDNAVIPHQVHLEELKKILLRAQKHHPFLLEADEYGSVSDKIIKMMTFRIPFYVGPLNDAHKKAGDEGFCWIVRRVVDSKEKILPWNFEQLVDRHKSAARFMERLSSKCTYIPTEDVLPKCSLLYQKFTVLNELNNLSLHGDRISVELKQKIYTELFGRSKKVTRKALIKYLIQQGVLSKGEEDAVSGIDEEINSKLSTLITLKVLFGDQMPPEDKLEEAILLITKLGMDKDMLHESMKEIFPDMSRKKLLRLCELDASGWGRLSHKLLTGISHETHGSMIDALWTTNANLMQLLGAEYGYGKLIDSYNDSRTRWHENKYEQVDNLFIPPAVKRGVRQSLRIIEEVVSIMGKAPQKICLEVARGPEEKKRTISRRLRLAAQYKKVQLKQWAEEIEKYTDARFKSDRLYLYYTQMGRCMYTGKVIEIDQLSTDYDIDHIQPISKTADDSLDNRVLVLKKENGRKSDIYPIDHSIRHAQAPFWKELYEKGLISRGKLNRLLRDQAMSEEELAGFINRQLVETRQSTKVVGKLLETLYPDTRVIYVKAGNISRFRQDNELIKIRELNDLHHGKDAYLSCVVGQVYDEKFTRNVLHFVKKKERYNLKVDKIFSRDLQRHERVIWRSGAEGSIATVRSMMQRHDLLITRMPQIETGHFFDQNIVSKRAGLVPIKSSDARLRDTERYGGYNSEKGAYFFLVEHGKGKKRIKTMEFVPVRLLKQIEQDDTALDSYCSEQLQLVEHRILIARIPKQSLLKINGVPYLLCGRGDKQLLFNHCVQLTLPPDLEAILKTVIRVNSIAISKEAKEGDAQYQIRKHQLTSKQCLALYDFFISKLESSIYGRIITSPLKLAQSYRDSFLDDSNGHEENKKSDDRNTQIIIQLCQDIVNLLYFFQCNAVPAIINGKKLSRIRYTKNITAQQSVSLINQSITGFYENSINLLEL